MSAERRQQIMEAATRCIAVNGLAGTTLAKIAVESGMSRGHVRHYAGNRDELLLSLAQWILADKGVAPIGAPDRSGRVDSADLSDLVEQLFGPVFSAPTDDNTVILELLRASRTDDAMRMAMWNGYKATRDELKTALRERFSAASEAAVDTTAYSLLALAMGNAVLNDLARDPSFDDLVREAGQTLIDHVEHGEPPA